MAQDRYSALSINQEGTKPTYSASISGFTPVASSTDFITINNPVGSTKLVKILHYEISGVATAAIQSTILSIKRSTLNTSGTFTSLASIPYDSNDLPATAIVNAYTANPTLGVVIGTIKTIYLGLSTPATSGNIVMLVDFGNKPSKCLLLRPGESFSLNYNNAIPGLGTLLNMDIEWTEEALQ